MNTPLPDILSLDTSDYILTQLWYAPNSSTSTKGTEKVSRQQFAQGCLSAGFPFAHTIARRLLLNASVCARAIAQSPRSSHGSEIKTSLCVHCSRNCWNATSSFREFQYSVHFITRSPAICYCSHMPSACLSWEEKKSLCFTCFHGQWMLGALTKLYRILEHSLIGKSNYVAPWHESLGTANSSFLLCLYSIPFLFVPLPSFFYFLHLDRCDISFMNFSSSFLIIFISFLCIFSIFMSRYFLLPYSVFGA